MLERFKCSWEISILVLENAFDGWSYELQHNHSANNCALNKSLSKWLKPFDQHCFLCAFLLHIARALASRGTAEIYSNDAFENLIAFPSKNVFFFLLFSSLRRWTPHFQLVAENLNVNHFCNIHSTCMKYYTRRTESLQFYGGSKIPISFYCLRAPILHAWKDWPLIIFRAYMHNAQPWTKSTLVLALFRSNFFSCTYFESISSSTFKNWL